MSWDIAYVGFVLGHGGDAYQMLDLAEQMAVRGKKVRVVVPQIPTSMEFEQVCHDRGVEVLRTPLIRADPVAPRQVPADLNTLFGTLDARIIHLHTGDFCLSRSVPVALGEVGISPQHVIATVHSPYDTLTKEHERARAWAAAIGPRISRVVCPSHHACATQIRYGVDANRVSHIPNGINVEKFGGGDPLAIQTELGMNETTPLIVSTSRLDTQKRPQDLLEAFAMALDTAPGARLAFVGMGELQSDLELCAARHGVADRVLFAGHRSDIPNWLAAATVWALPTERESFSLSVLEALAAGCPIVSTACPGNDEVLEDGCNALLHDVGDVPALAHHLRRLLRDSNLRYALSQEARLCAERYSTVKMADDYAALYEQMDLDWAH